VLEVPINHFISKLSNDKKYFNNNIVFYYRICKVNRQNSPNQPIYLNAEILNEMLHALFYLFNNNLQLDAYIAIEAIALKAEEDLLVDVILTSNSIKNLIQQSKTEPSFQNALKAHDSSLEKNPVSRSSSISLNRKKSNDNPSPSNRVSPTSSPKSSLYKLHENETKNNLSEIYVSPSGEIRNAAKRASIKIQQQQQNVLLQQLQYAELLEKTGDVPPPVPTSPLPASQSESHLEPVKVDGIFLKLFSDFHNYLI
jgi:hypothetical protein